MKKYVLSSLAVILAVGFIAFKPMKKDEVTLKFDPSKDVFISGDVTTASNWKENYTQVTCNSTAAACDIVVDITNTTGSAGSRVLDGSKVTLTAAGNSSTGYRPAAQAALLQIHNQPTP